MAASMMEEASDLLSVAVARIGVNGTLLQSNAGFRRLLGDASRAPAEVNVARYFIQPPFAALAGGGNAGEALTYRGLMTIGEYTGTTRTLLGRVTRSSGILHLVAEYDVEQMERASERALELSQEAAASQHGIARQNVALRQNEAAIVEDSLTDALTGLGNRRRLQQALETEIARAQRTNAPLGAVMADLDHFKQVNDVHGHAAGDIVLARFASIMRGLSRPTDIVARLGGEEFVVLLPGSDVAGAVAYAERIRAAVAAETIVPLPARVTASLGAAQWRAGESGEALLGRADAALYAAKHAGRNRVEIAAD